MDKELKKYIDLLIDNDLEVSKQKAIKFVEELKEKSIFNVDYSRFEKDIEKAEDIRGIVNLLMMTEYKIELERRKMEEGAREARKAIRTRLVFMKKEGNYFYFRKDVFPANPNLTDIMIHCNHPIWEKITKPDISYHLKYRMIGKKQVSLSNDKTAFLYEPEDFIVELINTKKEVRDNRDTCRVCGYYCAYCTCHNAGDCQFCSKEENNCVMCDCKITEVEYDVKLDFEEWQEETEFRYQYQ